MDPGADAELGFRDSVALESSRIPKPRGDQGMSYDRKAGVAARLRAVHPIVARVSRGHCHGADVHQPTRYLSRGGEAVSRAGRPSCTSFPEPAALPDYDSVFAEARTKTTAERVFADEHRDSGIQFRTLQTTGKATLQKRIHRLVVGLSHIASAYDARRSDGQLETDQDCRCEPMDCNVLTKHGRLQTPTYVPGSKSQTLWRRNVSPRSSLEAFIRPGAGCGIRYRPRSSVAIAR